MLGCGLFARLEAKPGKEQELLEFLNQGLQLADQEATTPLWFALRLSPTVFAIFDAFADEAGRQAHLAGPIAKALMARPPISWFRLRSSSPSKCWAQSFPSTKRDSPAAHSISDRASCIRCHCHSNAGDNGRRRGCNDRGRRRGRPSTVAIPAQRSSTQSDCKRARTRWHSRLLRAVGSRVPPTPAAGDDARASRGRSPR